MTLMCSYLRTTLLNNFPPKENKKFALFQNSDFPILEHWPKLNTDRNTNFSGGQNICQVNLLNFF